MPKSSSIYTRGEVLYDAPPFEVKLSHRKPLDYSVMSREQFDIEMEKGLNDLNDGLTVPSEHVRENMQRKYQV